MIDSTGTPYAFATSPGALGLGFPPLLVALGIFSILSSATMIILPRYNLDSLPDCSPQVVTHIHNHNLLPFNGAPTSVVPIARS